jgi:PTH2 family peptidyl-tRNA hydrolase
MKLAVVVRKDFGMSCGKIAGQVGHACVLAYRNGESNKIEDWMRDGVQKKIILKVPNEITLLKIQEAAMINNVQVNVVHDLGLTQLEPNTLTCIAIGPDEDDKIDNVVGGLVLL